MVVKLGTFESRASACSSSDISAAIVVVSDSEVLLKGVQDI
jgi:hypothetical protein